MSPKRTRRSAPPHRRKPQKRGATLAQLRRAVEELRSIVEATKRLNSTLDLAELINIILQIATRQTGADRGTVFLADHERDELWSLVGLGLTQQEIRLPASKGLAGWVLRHGENRTPRQRVQRSAV